VSDAPNVLLRLSNDADNIALVRQALSGVAEQLELEAGALNDIRTAATEACNNVSLHAYSGAEGPLEIELRCERDRLVVVVRDHGTGIRPRIRAASDSALGIGLAIIQALTRRVEFNDPPGGGTEVRMEFAATPVRAFRTARALRWAPDPIARDGLGSTTTIAIAPSRLAQSVLPRVLTVLATRAGFTTDRISDVLMIADALAVRSEGAGGSDEVRLTAHVTRRRMELEVGPLSSGHAHELVSSASERGPESVIERLTDEHRIDREPDAREATLVLALSDRV
jgi:anti-sigma regulatory factor (Ser/Thr protein kinase)